MGARGRFSDDGAATPFAITSGNNARAGAAATASGSTGARPAASRTGMRAGAIENRKPSYRWRILRHILCRNHCCGRLQQGRKAFANQRWFTTEVAQRTITLKVFKIHKSKVINSTLWNYWSQSDAMYAFCEVNSHISNSIVRICKECPQHGMWKPNR